MGRQSTSLTESLLGACRDCLAQVGFFGDEREFQQALVNALGPRSCSTEAHIVGFANAVFPPPKPPAGVQWAGDVCQKRGTRRLDLLWNSVAGPTAIELKYQRRAKWAGTFQGKTRVEPAGWADINGYNFLKDIHRLERLAAVRTSNGAVVTPKRRFAVFLTNEPKDYLGQIPHPGVRLREGVLKKRHLVQFSRKTSGGLPTSLNTLWEKYPPFRLGAEYSIKWTDLQDDVSLFNADSPTSSAYPSSRLLIVEVRPQKTNGHG